MSSAAQRAPSASFRANRKEMARAGEGAETGGLLAPPISQCLITAGKEIENKKRDDVHLSGSTKLGRIISEEWRMKKKAVGERVKRSV